MIIKSMSRKQATFSQLVDYFEDGRQDEKYNIYHNLYVTDKEQIKAEFSDNARFLPKRKNGVYLYHEVLSISTPDNLSREQQKELLKAIGLDYVQSRAGNNLVYGVLHDDKKDNLHYHFMISSNELMSEKRYRLSKEQFSQIKKDLELSVLEKYPQLQQKKLINKEQRISKETDIKEKLSNKGAELKRRTGKTTQRDNVKERLQNIFEQTKTKAEFFDYLEKEQLSIYVNGNTIGIIDKITNRKHRLNTLGMLDKFNAVSKIIESAEAVKDYVLTGEVKPQGNSVAKEFSKERINTRSYRQQDEPQKPNPNEQPNTANQQKPQDEKQQHHERERDYRKRDDLYSQTQPSKENESKNEAKDEIALEIERRKAQLRKERENEMDYSNEYSKGK